MGVTIFKTIFLAVSFILLISGCSGAPMLKLPKQGIDTTLPNASVAQAIEAALNEELWKIDEKTSQQIKATKMKVNGWSVQIGVDYTAQEYSIKYLSSKNLRYDPSAHTIHPNYNLFILKLNKGIKYRLRHVPIVEESRSETLSVNEEISPPQQEEWVEEEISPEDNKYQKVEIW